MKANLKNILMIVAALLVVYVVAFFVMMEVKVIRYRHFGFPGAFPGYWNHNYERAHVPRWGTRGRNYTYSKHWHDTLFEPLIWVEHQVLPPEYWEWKEGRPEPDWVKPWQMNPSDP